MPPLPSVHADVPLDIGHRLRVLVVGEQPASRIALATHLRLSGHDVEMADDGRKALDLASLIAFDVVLISFQMPPSDRLEAIRGLRALGRPGGPLRIVALTNDVSPEGPASDREAGLDGALRRPWPWRDLAAMLARWFPVDRST